MNDQQSRMPVRQEFGALASVVQNETASSAVAAQAKAMVEARYIMALKRPRNWDQVRQDILRECRRPNFAANKSTYYRKPIGKGVEGLGIRFTEMALRCMTNVLIETTTVYEDAEKEIIRVSVTDLEANTTYPLDVRVSKTVERSKPADDGTYLSVRMNSYDKPVYTVPATDDDLLNKRGALISKAQRTLALRIIPGDIQDEAEAVIKEIRMAEAARDPDAERKRLADAFAEIGVKAVSLADYLGHGLDSCTPSELVDLRGIYGAIRDGEASWASVIENRRGEEKRPQAEERKKTSGVEQPAAVSKKPDVAPAGDQAPQEEVAAAEGAPGKEEQVKQVPRPPEEHQGGASRGQMAEAASPTLVKRIRDRAAKFNVTEERILQRHGLTSLDTINTGVANVILAWLMAGAKD